MAWHWANARAAASVQMSAHAIASEKTRRHGAGKKEHRMGEILREDSLRNIEKNELHDGGESYAQASRPLL